MKAIKLATLLLLTGIILPLFVSAQDWPQFRGPGRDSKVTGFTSPAKWPAELKQAWKVNIGTGDATPVLSGNLLYAHSRQVDNEVVMCLDAATGSVKWKDVYPSSPVTGPAGSHPGPRGTPALAQGRLITFGAAGIISCYDAGTGKLVWRKENPGNAVPQFFTGASPLVNNGICYLHTGTKDKGVLYAIDITNGNIKWKWEGEGPSYASPSVMPFGSEMHLVLQTEYNLCAFNTADGRLLWKVATPVAQRFYNCTSPLINNKIIYFTGAGTGTKAIEVVKTGNEYTVKELWSNTEAGAKWCTPILRNGFLYGFSDLRRVYCINAADGKTAWIDNTTNSDFSTIIDTGNEIIGLPSTGNLLVFKADPAGYNEIAKYKVADTPVYAFPIVSGKSIYVKDAEGLTRYDL